MKWIESALIILDSQMTTPSLFGWFHILWLAITAVATVMACIYGPKLSKNQVNNIVLLTAIVVAALEIMKQINFSFSAGDNGIEFDYQWYAFPFQFCSTPMYVGLLAGLIRKGRLYDHLCAYLATYAVFAGLVVMFYPGDVFIGTICINVQTMICHGSMIPIGALLYASGVVKAEHKTIFRAGCVFSIAVALASVMNELAYVTGLLDSESFNMFYISPHCSPSLPVYSLVQQALPFPFCLIVYVLAFSAAAYVLLLIAVIIRRKKVSFSNSSKTPLTSSRSFAIMR